MNITEKIELQETTYDAKESFIGPAVVFDILKYVNHKPLNDGYNLFVELSYKHDGTTDNACIRHVIGEQTPSAYNEFAQYVAFKMEFNIGRHVKPSALESFTITISQIKTDEANNA